MSISKPSKLVSVRLQVALIVASAISGISSAFSAIPVFDSEIGFLSPADTYAVDIVVGDDGNVYTIDPYSDRIRVETPAGVILREFYGTNYWLARGIARDSAGNVYVSDSSQRIIDKFDATGALVATWTAVGDVTFSLPRGMFVDHEDRLWVADGGLNKIIVINSDGSLDRIWGAPGAGDGQLSLPTDVFVTNAGEVFVTSAGSGVKLQKFDVDGNLLAVLARLADFPNDLPWPSAVVVNSAGDIYVNDRANHRILQLDATGAMIREWGSQGSAPGQFIHSHGIALGANDSIWVAGYHGHDIQQFSSSGAVIQQIKRFESSEYGNADQRGLALDSNGNIFVSDGWNQRVKKLSSAGQLTTMWGTRGTGEGPFFNFPKAIAVDSQDNVYVSEDDGIRMFTNNGAFVDFFGPYDSFMDEARAMAFDAMDNLYVADTLHDRIVMLEAGTGNVLLEWGTKGADPGQFIYPRGMDFGTDGNLYIADNNKRVQVFAPDGTFLRQWSTDAEGASLSVMGHSDGSIYVGTNWTIARYTSNGVLIETWGQRGSGPNEFSNVWDIREAHDGSLLVSDQLNGRIQRLVFPTVISSVGKPKFQPGGDLGHFLWQDDDDGEWHLRWSGNGPLHQFGATITGIGGEFALVREVSFEGGDQLTQSSGQLHIDAYTGSWEDGIDFFAQPEALLKFEVRIDNAPAGGLVFLGAGAETPPTTPFYVPAQPVLQPEIFSSRGAPSYLPGQSLGYYLWQGNSDGVWHLRWNSDGSPHSFSGSVAAAGPITNVSPFSLEIFDSYEVDNFLLKFSGRASTWDDGLDFELAPGTTMVLRLAIDGQRNEQTVFIGPNEINPSGPQFALFSVPPLSAVDPLGAPPFVGGQDLGYFIWVDEAGTWHIRGNPDGAVREFTGTITADAPITSLIPVNLEPNDDVTRVDQTIQLEMSAASWLDGFDFTVEAGGRITFYLNIDGVPASDLTYIGIGAQNPEQVPFALE